MENSNQQRIKEITERLETGIRELYVSVFSIYQNSTEEQQ